MKMTSPIFHSGTVEIRREIWADGLLEMGAIMKSWALSGGQSRYACDSETLESITCHVTEAQQELISMIGALGSITYQVRDSDVPPGTMANIGYLIAGLSRLQEDLNTALDWMRPRPGYSPVGDMQLFSGETVELRSASDGAIGPETLIAQAAKGSRHVNAAPSLGAAGQGAHEHDADLTNALADLAECRAASGGDDVKAGARFARSMLQSTLATGEPSYDAQAFDIQRYFAAATSDANSEDFVNGFTMGIATCLAADLGDRLDWDPVDDLVQAGICDPDRKLPPQRPTAAPIALAPRRATDARTKAASPSAA